MENSFDPRSFRDALGAFTTGVTIVTTRDGQGNDVGLTANSFNSVSLDPPLVLWSLAKSSLSLKAFVEAEHFAVHILATDQQALSDLFAKRGADKFSGLVLKRGHGNVPLLDGCSARFECKTTFRYEGGDHEIFVGQVITFEYFNRPSLVFHGGKYAVAVQKPVVSQFSDDSDGSFSHDSLSYLIGNAHYLLDLKFRSVLALHQLNQRQIYAISLLGAQAPRTYAQLAAAMDFTGNPLIAPDLEELQRREFVRSVDGEGTFELTDSGRLLLMETVAIAKAAEEDALQSLNFDEMQLFRQLLKRVVRSLSRDMKPA